MPDIKWTNERKKVVADIERIIDRVQELHIDLENHYPSVVAKSQALNDLRKVDDYLRMGRNVLTLLGYNINMQMRK